MKISTYQHCWDFEISVALWQIWDEFGWDQFDFFACCHNIFEMFWLCPKTMLCWIWGVDHDEQWCPKRVVVEKRVDEKSNLKLKLS